MQIDLKGIRGSYTNSIGENLPLAFIYKQVASRVPIQTWLTFLPFATCNYSQGNGASYSIPSGILLISPRSIFIRSFL